MTNPMAARIPLDGARDHGVSEALYLRDPDQNGVELSVMSTANGLESGG